MDTVYKLEHKFDIEKLKKEVPTATLMGNPTVDGWVSAYAEA